MTKLSVNINKFATLRNSRGGNLPDLTQTASDCIRFGAEGITMHPRPDERHIRYSDVRTIRPLLTVEFNIEGYPDDRFIELVTEVVPDQVTLVPDLPGQLTSNAGWNVKKNKSFLRRIVHELHKKNIRTSIFIDTDVDNIAEAPDTGTDRVELYTGPYAEKYGRDKAKAVTPFVEAAQKVTECGLGLNAGHDLSLVNLKYFKSRIPDLSEVSIGHALICDALYYGLENAIQLYKRQLR